MKRGAGCRRRGSHQSRLPLAGAPPGGGLVGLDGDAVRNLVQPAAQGLAPSDRRGLLDQHEEGGLEGVLDVARVAEDAAADAQHHRAVSRHQDLEGAPSSLLR